MGQSVVPPTRVRLGGRAIAIAGGYGHSLALLGDGTVWAWGQNVRGQLGDGASTDRAVPAQVHGLSDVVAIAAGYEHNLALQRNGTVWAWGQNYYGQIGDGTEDDHRLTPVQVEHVEGIGLVEAGDSSSYAWVSPEHRVQGRVDLLQLASSPLGLFVRIEVRDEGGDVVRQATNVPLAADGSFSLPTLLVGTFDVSIQGSNWLRTTLSGINVTSGGASGLEFSLRNGDVNGDNRVDVADFLGLRMAFGSGSSSPNWNHRADLNKDGNVGIADFLILRANFGRNGDV